MELINTDYRRRAVSTQNKISDILKEGVEQHRNVNEKLIEDSEFKLENMSDMFNFNSNARTKMNRMSLQEEFTKKRCDLAQKIFVEAVIASLPVEEELIKGAKSELDEYISKAFEGLKEAGLFMESNDKGAWMNIIRVVDLQAKNESLTFEDSYFNVVNECKVELSGLIDRVSDKIERAIKSENAIVKVNEEMSLIENHTFQRDKKQNLSLFRTLCESNYKNLLNESPDSSVKDSVFRAAIDYAILETINTARIVEGLNFEHVNKYYKVLGK